MSTPPVDASECQNPSVENLRLRACKRLRRKECSQAVALARTSPLSSNPRGSASGFRPWRKEPRVSTLARSARGTWERFPSWPPASIAAMAASSRSARSHQTRAAIRRSGEVKSEFVCKIAAALPACASPRARCGSRASRPAPPPQAGAHALGGRLAHVAREVGLAALPGGAGGHLPGGRHEPLVGIRGDHPHAREAPGDEGAQEVRPGPPRLRLGEPDPDDLPAPLRGEPEATSSAPDVMRWSALTLT